MACFLSHRLKQDASSTFRYREYRAYPCPRAHSANASISAARGVSGGCDNTMSPSTMCFISAPSPVLTGQQQEPTMPSQRRNVSYRLSYRLQSAAIGEVQ